ncbi:MAG: nucleotidyltransferase domain-containing protein [Candidatus Marinimicrobia bacterium]|nr:nucleotidyltransferase domain-containing protein [Candidatus Neomarinimicrobiota bacterium]
MDKRAALKVEKKIITFLKENKFNIQKAYIFGSYAKRSFHEDSDIDLAIIMSNLPDTFNMQVQLMKLGSKFDTRIEPHPFDETDFNTSNPFANEILRTGIQIV